MKMNLTRCAGWSMEHIDYQEFHQPGVWDSVLDIFFPETDNPISTLARDAAKTTSRCKCGSGRKRTLKPDKSLAFNQPLANYSISQSLSLFI
jgi:hypothetical protein